MSTEMVNFEITSDLAAMRGQIIEANFDQVKGWLEENLAPFATMVVTPDMISGAKTYRANIRKVASRIDESRKEAKAAALAAYEAFDAKCKELTGMCADAADNLDRQIKGYEERERNEKIARLEAVYREAADDQLLEFCPWEYVFDPAWGNKSCSEQKAGDEIRFSLNRAREDLDTIRGMGSEFLPALLDCYRQTHEIGSVLRKAAALRQMKEAEEQRRKAAEQARSAERPTTAPADGAAKASATVSADGPAERDMERRLFTLAFRVTGTAEQLKALKAFMIENGIHYGRMKGM